MARKDTYSIGDIHFYSPKQRVRCRNKGCFRDFSNQQPHDIIACWPTGTLGKRGKPAPTTLADGTLVQGLTWKTRTNTEATND